MAESREFSPGSQVSSHTKLTVWVRQKEHMHVKIVIVVIYPARSQIKYGEKKLILVNQEMRGNEKDIIGINNLARDLITLSH